MNSGGKYKHAFHEISHIMMSLFNIVFLPSIQDLGDLELLYQF